jgi:hypothetical protein
MKLQASAMSCARPGSGQVGSSCDPISPGSSRRSSQLSNMGVTNAGHSVSHLLPSGMSSHLQRLHTRVLGGHQDPLYCTSNLVLQVRDVCSLSSSISCSSALQSLHSSLLQLHSCILISFCIFLHPFSL